MNPEPVINAITTTIAGREGVLIPAKAVRIMQFEFETPGKERMPALTHYIVASDDRWHALGSHSLN